MLVELRFGHPGGLGRRSALLRLKRASTLGQILWSKDLLCLRQALLDEIFSVLLIHVQMHQFLPCFIVCLFDLLLAHLFPFLLLKEINEFGAPQDCVELH